MAIVRLHRPVAAARIAAIARQLLDASELCAIATVAPRGRAHVNTAYFAWSPHFEIVWLSEPRAMHSRNLRSNGTVAIAVYDSRQTWGKPDRGVQLFGSRPRRPRQTSRAPRSCTRSASPGSSTPNFPPTASISSHPAD